MIPITGTYMDDYLRDAANYAIKCEALALDVAILTRRTSREIMQAASRKSNASLFSLLEVLEIASRELTPAPGAALLDPAPLPVVLRKYIGIDRGG